jgi:hypothetical protein
MIPPKHYQPAKCCQSCDYPERINFFLVTHCSLYDMSIEPWNVCESYIPDNEV